MALVPDIQTNKISYILVFENKSGLVYYHLVVHNAYNAWLRVHIDIHGYLMQITHFYMALCSMKCIVINGQLFLFSRLS